MERGRKSVKRRGGAGGKGKVNRYVVPGKFTIKVFGTLKDQIDFHRRRKRL